MNEVVVREELHIKNMIYEIRGQQVMLDSDLAKLYKCSNGTKSINLAVKRHIKRFPERFMFQLTKEEALSIYSRFQFETLKNSIDLRGSNIKYLPYVFTEQGVAMLATVLRTDVAEEVSIAIMDAFVSMRHYISSNLLEQGYINNMVLKHDGEIRILQDTFKQFKPKNNHIFLEDQVYDAYSLFLDILNQSKKEILIIDNYASKELLDTLKKIDKKIIIVSKNIDEVLKKKYEVQYNNITFINDNSFHDRFIMIDRKKLYHCGSSFKDLGKKCFGINKIEEVDVIDKMISKVNSVINNSIKY